MLYRPQEHATPSERLLAAARHDRLARIAARATPEKPLTVPKFIEPVSLVPPVIETESWADRQKRIHPEPWFSIVDEIDLPEPRRPTIEEIQRACCRYFSFTKTLLVADRRTAPVVYARQVAMYLAKTLTLRSLPEIGRKFAGRDHTTVLHAVRKIDGLIFTDWTVAYDVAHAEAMI